MISGPQMLQLNQTMHLPHTPVNLIIDQQIIIGLHPAVKKKTSYMEALGRMLSDAYRIDASLCHTDPEYASRRRMWR